MTSQHDRDYEGRDRRRRPKRKEDKLYAEHIGETYDSRDRASSSHAKRRDYDRDAEREQEETGPSRRPRPRRRETSESEVSRSSHRRRNDAGKPSLMDRIALNGGRYDGLAMEEEEERRETSGSRTESKRRSGRSANRPGRKEGDGEMARDVDASHSPAERKFELGADFVPFDFDSEDDEKRVEKGKAPAVREWDKGKRKAVDSPGRKRKAEQFDADDGFVNKKQRINAAARKAPWAEYVDWESCSNVAEMLHREVEAFVNYISPTPAEDEVRGMIVVLVRKVVTKQFPDATVRPFGSYETKLYLPLGDIDLVIQSDQMAYSDKVTVLHALANVMKRSGITDKVSIIAKAKVPIIKFVTTHGRFSVDISINQANGVPVVQMIGRFLTALPALKPLVLIVKTFLSQRSMNEVFTGGLGSYALVCMVISFLQMHPKVRRGEIDPSRNLGVLVMEFFELYGCYFNYHEVGISVRDGGTYFSKAQRGWLDHYKSHLLSIEDPADPSNDISKGSYGINRVRTTLAGAHGIMTAAAYLRAGMISARRTGRHVFLRDEVKYEEMSILSSVLGITQETLNHRRVVQEVYDSGMLHRMLGLTPTAGLDDRTARQDKTRVSGQSRSPARSRREAASVASAWADADTDVDQGLSSPDEDRRQHRAVADHDEESRYGFSKRQPPKKRQRTGTAKDAHTYFTTDDEDEDGLVRDEERRFEGEADPPLDKTRATSYSDRNRSYWLSKGIGSGASDDEGSS